MNDRQTLQRIEREGREAEGQPLDASVRQQMEARVGSSLHGGRDHLEARASLLANGLGRAAFTSRHHGVFGPGMYASGAPRRIQRVAHEDEETEEMPEEMPEEVEAIASRGVEGPGGALPHLDRIQASFGRHDVRTVRAHTGASAG